MTTFIIERTCEKCGAVVSAREDLSPLNAFILHVVEVVWCPECGAELPAGERKSR